MLRGYERRRTAAGMPQRVSWMSIASWVVSRGAIGWPLIWIPVGRALVWIPGGRALVGRLHRGRPEVWVAENGARDG